MNNVVKKVLNSVICDIVAYILIILLGLVIVSATYGSNMLDGIKVLISFLMSFFVSLMMIMLGYISAKKRKGIKKYLSVFVITVIFGIVNIFGTFFGIINISNWFTNLFIFSNNLFVNSFELIFSWISDNISFQIGYIIVWFTLILMFLGARLNVKKERNSYENK